MADEEEVFRIIVDTTQVDEATEKFLTLKDAMDSLPKNIQTSIGITETIETKHKISSPKRGNTFTTDISGGAQHAYFGGRVAPETKEVVRKAKEFTKTSNIDGADILVTLDENIFKAHNLDDSVGGFTAHLGTNIYTMKEEFLVAIRAIGDRIQKELDFYESVKGEKLTDEDILSQLTKHVERAQENTIYHEFTHVIQGLTERLSDFESRKTLGGGILGGTAWVSPKGEKTFYKGTPDTNPGYPPWEARPWEDEAISNALEYMMNVEALENLSKKVKDYNKLIANVTKAIADLGEDYGEGSEVLKMMNGDLERLKARRDWFLDDVKKWNEWKRIENAGMGSTAWTSPGGGPLYSPDPEAMKEAFHAPEAETWGPGTMFDDSGKPLKGEWGYLPPGGHIGPNYMDSLMRKMTWTNAKEPLYEGNPSDSLKSEYGKRKEKQAAKARREAEAFEKEMDAIKKTKAYQKRDLWYSAQTRKYERRSEKGIYALLTGGSVPGGAPKMFWRPGQKPAAMLSNMDLGAAIKNIASGKGSLGKVEWMQKGAQGIHNFLGKFTGEEPIGALAGGTAPAGSIQATPLAGPAGSQGVMIGGGSPVAYTGPAAGQAAVAGGAGTGVVAAGAPEAAGAGGALAAGGGAATAGTLGAAIPILLAILAALAVLYLIYKAVTFIIGVIQNSQAMQFMQSSIAGPIESAAALMMFGIIYFVQWIMKLLGIDPVAWIEAAMGVLRNNFEFVSTTFGEVLDHVRGIFSNLGEAFNSLTSFFDNLLGGNLGSAIQDLFNVFDNILEAGQQWVAGAVDFILGIFQSATMFIIDAILGFFVGIGLIPQDFADKISEAFRWIFGAVRDIVTFILTLPSEILQQVYEFISSVIARVTGAIQWVIDGINTLVDWFINSPGTLFQKLETVFDKLGETIKEKFWGAFEWVINKVLGIFGLDISTVNRVYNSQSGNVFERGVSIISSVF